MPSRSTRSPDLPFGPHLLLFLLLCPYTECSSVVETSLGQTPYSQLDCLKSDSYYFRVPHFLAHLQEKKTLTGLSPPWVDFLFWKRLERYQMLKPFLRISEPVLDFLIKWNSVQPGDAGATRGCWNAHDLGYYPSFSFPSSLGWSKLWSSDSHYYSKQMQF